MYPVANPSNRTIWVYIPHLRMGGGETSMLRLAHGLGHIGLHVTLIVHTLSGAELEVQPHIEVVNLECKGTASAWWQLVQRLRKHRPTWLLSAFPHTNIAAVAAVLAAQVHTRCVVTEHAPLSQQIAQQKTWRYRLLPVLVGWAYRRAAAVVAVSQGVRDDLIKLLQQKVQPHVLYNPVLAPQFEEELLQPKPHPWLEDSSLSVIVNVGRLSIEKNLSLLVDAFAAIHQQHPHTRLLLVGEGPTRSLLEKQVQSLGLQNVVQLPGRTNHPLRWMKNAAVFVLASQYEGFGNVVVEAMACGTPVVSTDCPVGPREILEQGRWGSLVPLGQTAPMVDAIRQALSQACAPAGAQAVARQYTQANASAAYYKLLKTLVSAECN
jgi:glycosyltransferase involved in cell wall biosynthesis